MPHPRVCPLYNGDDSLFCEVALFLQVKEKRTLQQGPIDNVCTGTEDQTDLLKKCNFFWITSV